VPHSAKHGTQHTLALGKGWPSAMVDGGAHRQPLPSADLALGKDFCNFFLQTFSTVFILYF
jgi:hypothetical protein